ncbi:MAG: FecR family protein [Eubacterium sp.]|nr:FecR family protein [Eubacterium sp.]
MGKKKIIIITSAVIVLAIIAIIVFINIFKKDDYRLLKVFEVEGEASVTREKIGEIEPYENMVLESGDHISLIKGLMTLQADEDKFIHLEEGTEIVLNASGNADKSRTSIELLSGGITNDVQNKLLDESSYEINTPNSTMSVRGTLFRVYTYIEDGIRYTKVSVFEGKVASYLIFKDGTKSQEEVIVEGGKEVIIYQDDKTTDYVSGPTDIDYSDLPDSVLDVLSKAIDQGRSLPLTKEEIAALKERTVTVTFIYNGKTFATQSVKKGEKVALPSLKPAESGKWDYDFDLAVEEDIEINWK